MTEILQELVKSTDSPPDITPDLEQLAQLTGDEAMQGFMNADFNPQEQGEDLLEDLADIDESTEAERELKFKIQSYIKSIEVLFPKMFDRLKLLETFVDKIKSYGEAEDLIITLQKENPELLKEIYQQNPSNLKESLEVAIKDKATQQLEPLEDNLEIKPPQQQPNTDNIKQNLKNSLFGKNKQ